MNPEDKAKELIELFLSTAESANDYPVVNQVGIDCAIEFVDKMLDQCVEGKSDANAWKDGGRAVSFFVKEYQYWSEVKVELEKYEDSLYIG